MSSTDFPCTTASHYCKSSILAQIIPTPQQTHLKGAGENQRPSLQYEETQRSSLQSSLNNSTPPPACPALLGTAVAKGTVDFIFGNTAAVLQDYNLHARRPLPNQNSIFTTWAREDPNQNTGGSGHVAAGAPRTYLGHPWKQYSRTVFLQSELDAIVNPIGWIAWDDDFTPDKF